MVPGKPDDLLEREHVARYRFASSFASGCSVLDAACGMGYAAPMFMQAGARSYLGVDLDADSVNSAMEKYRINDEVSFVVDDACELRKVPDGAFDLVVSFETIEHLPRPEVFLANVRRVLREGGTFVVSTPNRLRYSPGNKLSSKPWNPYHIKEWDVEEFLDVLEPCFRVTQVLGQMPLAQWKAQTLYFAAKLKWLNNLISILHAAKEKAKRSSSNGNALPSDIHAVKPIPPWYTPVFAVCVAKPR
jgi:SAM-dependent methyltransferase